MNRRHLLWSVAWLFASATFSPGQTTADAVMLEGGNFRARVSVQDGRVKSLLRKGGANLLRRPIAISVRDEVSGKVETLAGPLSKLQKGASFISFTQQLSDLVVISKFTAKRELSLEVKLQNKTGERRDLSVLFDFSGLRTVNAAFFPSGYPHPRLPVARELVYGYRAAGESLVIPSATFYSRAKDAGVTVLSPLEVPVPGFQVRLRPSAGPQVGRTDLRLEPQGEVRTQILVSLHEPDWRPGLAYIRDRYPKNFTARNPQALDINGPFIYSPTAAEGQVQQWHEQGVRWVEVHFTYPFLGKYAPTEPHWTPAMDDHWCWEKVRQSPDVPAFDAPFELIKNYLEKRLTPWETPERVRAFIRLLHKYDIKALMYFQPTECWERYAAEHFNADAVRNEKGDIVATYYEDIVLNPRPGSAWAEYIEQQFKDLLALYPEADGIFQDQSGYDILDFAHDDGFSIHKGRPAYRMGYSLYLLTSKLAEYAHALGKIVWWNGPYQVELGAIGDGHLTEGSGQLIRWLGIGTKPITSTAWHPDLYDRMLLYGGQPAAASLMTIYQRRYSQEVPADLKPPAEQLRWFERYAPLFQQIQQREWVLAASAVEVPAGLEANIFRLPDGNYAVPVITPWADESTGTFLDVPVTARVADTAEIRGVYLLRPDFTGWFRPPWKRFGKTLVITIPRHHRASLLILAKKGFFAALSGEGVVVKAGGRDVKLVLENFLKEPVRGEAQLESSRRSFKLAPEASISLSIPPESLKPSEGGRLVFPVRISFSGGVRTGSLSFPQELQQVSPLEVGWSGTLRGYVGAVTPATLYVINHSREKRLVNVRVHGLAAQVSGVPATIELAPAGRRLVPLRIRPEKPGLSEICFEVETSEEGHKLSVKLPVWRTRFSRAVEAVSAHLEFDGLIPNGLADMRHGEGEMFPTPPMAVAPGPLPRPIRIDGRPVSYVPSLNQRRWRGLGVEIPRENLLELGRSFQLRFEPAHPQDEYRLRNTRLTIRLADGSKLSSSADPREYSTRVPGEAVSKPIEIRLEIPSD